MTFFKKSLQFIYVALNHIKMRWRHKSSAGAINNSPRRNLITARAGLTAGL